MTGSPLQRVSSASRYAPVIGFSGAVRADGWVLLSGVTAVGPHDEVTGVDDPYRQTRECLRKIELTLTQLGGTLGSVVQTRSYLTRVDDWREVGRAHGEVFAGRAPASTMVVVGGLLDERMLVEIEATAYMPS